MKTASDKIGVSKLTYSRWENGEQDPHLSSLELLCKAFETSPVELGFAHLICVPEETKEASASQPVLKDTAVIDEQATSSLLQQLGDTMGKFDESRRTLLQQTIGTIGTMATLGLVGSEPLERLSSALTRPAYIDETTLHHFQKLTQLCWELSSGSALSTVGAILSSYLPKLVQLVQHSSKHQQQAASIVSQGLQLTSIVVAHRLDLASKEAYCQQAVQYGKIAEDRNVQVTAMIELSVAFLYEGQLAKALQTFQDALQYINQVSPLIRARVFIGLGEAYARHGQKQEALRYLGLAYEAFPEHPENDPAFLFADCPLSLLALYEGQAHLHLNQPGEALKAFTSIEKFPQTTIMNPERIRLEVINHQAIAAIALKDIEQSCVSIVAGTQGALALGSQKRYNEAYDAYKLIRHIWPDEPQVKTLAELFQR